MDSSKDTSNGFNRNTVEQLYQLLVDLKENGVSDIYYDLTPLLSAEVDTMAAINRSAGIEKEAHNILKVFTNDTTRAVLRDVSPLDNSNELAARVAVKTIAKRQDCFKIDIWKNNQLVSSIENENKDLKDQQMHLINIKIDTNGSFVISGLESVGDDIKDIIRELSGLIALKDYSNINKNSYKEEEEEVKIEEIIDSIEETIEVPLPNGVFKFSANQNPIEILTDLYAMEETVDNKKIFKIPELGDFLVSPEDDPVTVFKTITGVDLTEFYKNATNEVENKENVKIVQTQRHKKNKQKRKLKKRK